MKDILNHCKTIIHDAKKIVVLTGAGISTESGIPDFRSKSGVYQLAPEYILSLDYFYEHPREFYQFAFENLYYPNAQPNKGHEILASLEKQGKIETIITQNIDGLHQKAGSQSVIEFHGTMRTASCVNCAKTYTTDEMVERYRTKQDFYICDDCVNENQVEHYIKPDVVLFGDRGDWFTDEGFQKITELISKADCLLVLGTSLLVTPFSIFPSFRNNGVPLIIVNKGVTPYDNEMDTYVIHESISSTLSHLMDL